MAYSTYKYLHLSSRLGQHGHAPLGLSAQTSVLLRADGHLLKQGQKTDVWYEV